MKKSFILAILLMIIIISLATSCDNSQVEVPKIDSNEEVEVIEVEAGKGIQIKYSIKYEEDIFGDLSKEKISEIVDGIFDKVSKNDEYKENTDLAIEEVFKEYGITDVNKLEVAKLKLIITKK